jgi:hypothetical protein
MDSSDIEITHVSLDYDLNDTSLAGPRTSESITRHADGMTVAKWMVQSGNIPSEQIIIHSHNRAGAQEMANYLSTHTKVPVHLRPYLV